MNVALDYGRQQSVLIEAQKGLDDRRPDNYSDVARLLGFSIRGAIVEENGLLSECSLDFGNPAALFTEILGHGLENSLFTRLAHRCRGTA